jgi:hypothetical protein
LAFAVPVPPISGAEVALVRRAIGEAAPDWSVELQGICADEAMLVVLPEDGDEATGPSFMISRETYGLRLAQMHWDTLTEVGVFASMKNVLAALTARLAFYPDLAVPASVTVH